MDLTFNSSIKLNNGVDIPRLGFGTYKLRIGSESTNAVHYAFETGYKHIDTAAVYYNEKEVGKALKESGIPRDQVFITTKLWNDDHGYDKTLDAFDRSLNNLNIDYMDLYLIHWPVSFLRNESWKALCKIYKDGRARAVGVSNYTIRHLEELLNKSDIVPAVNQVEFHPFLYQKELLDFCNKKGIQIEAYSPLMKGNNLNHPVLKDLSGTYHKTPAQILIRWSLQHDLITLPKSAKKERIIENSAVFDFEISDEDMFTLDSLDEGLRVAWNPEKIE